VRLVFHYTFSEGREETESPSGFFAGRDPVVGISPVYAAGFSGLKAGSYASGNPVALSSRICRQSHAGHQGKPDAVNPGYCYGG